MYADLYHLGGNQLLGVFVCKRSQHQNNQPGMVSDSATSAQSNRDKLLSNFRYQSN